MMLGTTVRPERVTIITEGDAPESSFSIKIRGVSALGWSTIPIITGLRFGLKYSKRQTSVYYWKTKTVSLWASVSTLSLSP
jgi:hypothetical protein